eukprot:TRINITY_DN6727_c0_g1_i1.p2 TRINITY_DN6727_c0_g1~~TRINITY_DN6727_c0_g1_i1.p2  ORF type:complete len:170 (-),score=18.49 TRINITY_DN6727_c0_g1_i1:742-1251(-)
MYQKVGDCLDNVTYSFNLENNTFIMEFYDNDECSGSAFASETAPLNTCTLFNNAYINFTLAHELPAPIPQLPTEVTWLDGACTPGSEVTFTQVTSNCISYPGTPGSAYYSCYHSNDVPYAVLCADDACKVNCTSQPLDTTNCMKGKFGSVPFYKSVYCSSSTQLSVNIN